MVWWSNLNQKRSKFTNFQENSKFRFLIFGLMRKSELEMFFNFWLDEQIWIRDSRNAEISAKMNVFLFLAWWAYLNQRWSKCRDLWEIWYPNTDVYKLKIKFWETDKQKKLCKTILKPHLFSLKQRTFCKTVLKPSRDRLFRKT